MDEQTEFKKLVEKGLMVVSSELEDKIKEEQRIREALKNNSKKKQKKGQKEAPTAPRSNSSFDIMV